MKANKKNKRKRQERVKEDAPIAQRVDRQSILSVREQIKYGKIRKEMASGGGLRTTDRSRRVKFRRAKDPAYENIVEEEDYSKVYMPKIAPTLMVDGYNILFFWQRTKGMVARGDFEGAREELVEELETLNHMRGWTVTV
ncbi:unnamed protein product, partial [Discosporangium mesarthrocarpum]